MKIIIIEHGDIFEGTVKQFMDCFFVVEDEENIRKWCKENNWTCEIINNET